jgi:hypothetical protein
MRHRLNAISRFLATFNAMCLVLGAACIVLVESRHDQAVAWLYKPVFEVCRAITPQAWQTLGNIPLGLTWFLIGTIVYGMIGAIAVASGARFVARHKQGDR